MNGRPGASARGKGERVNKSRFIMLFFAAAVMLAVTAPAIAAPPSNDTFEGATTASIGFSETIDTTEATTDATDEETTVSCDPGFMAATVWYSYTAGSEAAATVDLSGSDYSAGAIVVTGEPGNFSFVECGPVTFTFPVTSGETYHIVVFDDGSDGNPANGGLLSFALLEGQGPPTFELDFDPTGHFTKSGTAIVTGTFTCEGATFETQIFGFMQQSVGRFAVNGDFVVFDPPCDGTAQPFEAEIVPENGKFKGGTANITATASGCNDFFCNGVEVQDTVKLKH